MPKVETSLTQGADHLRPIIKNYVSNLIGNDLNKFSFSDLGFNIENFDEIHLRNKRDLISFSDDINIPTPRPTHRRRVVKKLIRIEPIYNVTANLRSGKSIKSFSPRDNNYLSSDTDTSTEPQTKFTTRRVRRKLVIKKKKRRIIRPDINILQSEEQLQQATKPRRKVVITRKRLLPNPSKSITVNDKTNVLQYSSVFSQNTTTSYSENETEPDEFNTNQDNERDMEDEDENADEDETEYDEENDSEDNNENGNYVNSDENYNDSEDIDNDYEHETQNEESFEDERYGTSDEDEENGVPYDVTDKNNFQHVPDYEPFFPEVSEALEAPILLLKTTILSSVELLTKTIVQTKLRTYTFVITRVSGDDQIVTSTTEVKPQTKTSILTEPVTKFTTLTLLDFDATSTLTPLPQTITPTLENPLLNQGRAYDEPRYNLATRVMSNGVEVIVAGDKSTLPGEPDVKRILPSTIYKPVTLKPSTLSDHMMMVLPQDASDIESLTSSLYPNQFVTKTCLTTFTYLTTYLESGTTTVSSHEQVVSNIATEERNTGKILPTPAMGITLTQYPKLSVGVFHTTYTYLNTILDGEQPLVVSSKHTVTNTVTAPDDYLSLLQPSEKVTALKDTNTYYSTVTLEKTLYEDEQSKVISTNEVVTQVVITESVPPKATSVMTSYIALDVEGPDANSLSEYTTTDVVKTYFVTYTYYKTMHANGKEIVETNISTSSDVVTEKLYLHPKKTNVISLAPTAGKDDKKKHKVDASDENFHILATKTYHTTFTYFTTLLQETNSATPIVISSRSRVVEKIVTETLDPSLLDKKYLNVIKSEIEDGSSSIVKVAKLQDGQKLEITAIANEAKEEIKPTKVLPIEKTKSPELSVQNEMLTLDASTPSVITGSTIVFIDDDPFAVLETPILSSTTKTIHKSKNSLGALLSSEIVKETKSVISISKTKRATKHKSKIRTTSLSPSKTVTVSSSSSKQKTSESNKLKPQDSKKKQPGAATKISKPSNQVQDLLGLGSININSLQALTPVLNAMAGLIQTNLKANRRNDTVESSAIPTSSTRPSAKEEGPALNIQNRSPVYIPVGGLADDFEIAESQNIATFHLQETIDDKNLPKDQVVVGKSTQERPLLNDGIPISPGEVITANSDVIVGKPGRIGPRLPAIPLNQVNDEIPVGMKPPPAPVKPWPKRNHEYKHIPVANLRNDKPVHNIIHAPNKDDYVGPPPPLQSRESVRGEKHKHIPLSPPFDERPYRVDQQPFEQEHRFTSLPINNYGPTEVNIDIPVNHQIYAQGQNNYGINYQINEVTQESITPNLKVEIQKNYEQAAKGTFPVYAQGQAPLLISSINHLFPSLSLGNDFNIQTSILSGPILPEVVERATGQPLLVNLQPSQVAFVNIPHNRTTALIYGGSTEPHKNGQYFDDPSPYPQPEFSGIESFNNGVPQFASIYHDTSPDQKRVNGVIKVENQLIKVEPSTGENKMYPLNINPSKPINQFQGFPQYSNNHEINVNVPPISFGMVQQGNDFNAHIIRHEDVSFKAPPISYHVKKNENKYVDNYGNLVLRQELEQNRRPEEIYQDRLNNNPGIYQNQPSKIPSQEIENLKPPNNVKKNSNRPEGYIQKSKHTQSLKHNILRPPRPRPEQKPVWEISEFMTPPPFVKISTNPPNRPLFVRPGSRPKKPLPIPLTPEPFHKITSNNLPLYNSQNTLQQNTPSYTETELDEIGDHREDDLENEDGEVIQESNSRPLRPGQVPLEVVKTSTEKLNVRNNTIRFPDDHIRFPSYNNKYNQQSSSVPNLQPLDFENRLKKNNTVHQVTNLTPQNPVVRPENQLTNQIISFGEVNNIPLQPSQQSNLHIGNQVLNFHIATNRPTTQENNQIYNPNQHFNFFTNKYAHNMTNLEVKGPPVLTNMNNFALGPHESFGNKFTAQNGRQPVAGSNLSNQQNVYLNENKVHMPNFSSKLDETNISDKIKNSGSSSKINTNEVVNQENIGTVSVSNNQNDLKSNSKPTTNNFNHFGNFINNQLDKNIGNNYHYTPEFSTITSTHAVVTQSTIHDIFGIRTRRPIPIHRYSTTTKPTGSDHKHILPNSHIYNNGKIEHVAIIPPVKIDRPKVTSLPIDTQTSAPQYTKTKPQIYESVGSQTEKPFLIPPTTYTPTNEINVIPEKVPILPGYEPKHTTQPTLSNVTPELNTGEVTIHYNNITTQVSDMEIMRPPPLVPEVIKEPDFGMQPPKIELISPGGDIQRVPSINTEKPFDLEAQSSSTQPTIPKPAEEMVPPPPLTINDVEVVGMNPPPLVSTHKPIISLDPITTTKPIFSLEIDPPKHIPDIPVVFEPTATTENYKPTRPHRPFTRRPGHYRTTIYKHLRTTTTASTTTRRPNHPTYGIFNRNTTTEEKNADGVPKITPTQSVKNNSIEKISENKNSHITQSVTPHFDDPQLPTNLENNVYLSGSKEPEKEITAEKTSSLKITPSNVTTLPSTNFMSSSEIEPSSKNSVKKTDQAAEPSINKSPQTTTQKSKLNVKEKTTVLPTRYITHTKTSTVTITKTTVVKTLGGPPSTLTILVTKTEKSTIVDTVTEVHTLVRPTSIVETITTTVKQPASSLYPPDVYGSPYPSIQIRPTFVAPEVVPTQTFTEPSDEDLNDFIISDTDRPTVHEESDPADNESIFVVMTDKNKGSFVKIPNSSHETQDRDEITTNEVNNVLLGGILIANPPKLNSIEEPSPKPTDKCEPECKPARNELCQKVEGLMRCVCRPGFARMFPDRPCIPTYTYNLDIQLDRFGREVLHFDEDLMNQNSTDHMRLASTIHDAIDRMVMQSDLRDIYHGVYIHGFENPSGSSGVISKFYLQLSDNIDENRLKDVLKKYLRNNNHSLGGTDIYASRENLNKLNASDFDECENPKFHDCSENAHCFNLKGTYTCSCKEGFSDLSENILYPGRICSAEQVGCERCNYHGTCYSRGDDQILCECFQWYAGENCHINLKVLLIALVTLGSILFVLLLICIIMTCMRKKPRPSGVAAGMSFLPQRVGNPGTRGPLDRRAMIQDTSSEDSRSETNTALPYVAKKQIKPKGALKKTSRVSMQTTSEVENGENTLFSDQKDRSLTVMIPRAKYHPAPPTSPLINYTTFDARKPSVPSSSNEAKLLSYLDAGPTPNKTDQKRKYSNATSESYIEEKPSSRKTSGALVSAGFEVSATVVNNMGTLGTTCGTEADRSENATLIQKISADLLSSTGTRSQFNTLRQSLVDNDIDPMSNWLDIAPIITTVSEVRSYDETTIPPPMKSFRNDYDSKPSSQQQNDEANTMAERDLGSTFLLPHTHLYKPDRGSDISGFESL